MFSFCSVIIKMAQKDEIHLSQTETFVGTKKTTNRRQMIINLRPSHMSTHILKQATHPLISLVVMTGGRQLYLYFSYPHDYIKVGCVLQLWYDWLLTDISTSDIQTNQFRKYLRQENMCWVYRKVNQSTMLRSRTPASTAFHVVCLK